MPVMLGRRAVRRWVSRVTAGRRARPPPRPPPPGPPDPFVFYLGTDQVDWLARLGVPLFVSRRSLAPRRSLPIAAGPWALDSGGFSELALHGRWTVTAPQYAAEVRRFRDEIGGLRWAAVQDWMCDPKVLCRTGLSVQEHQARTVTSYLELSSLAPDLPWVPVLQGWSEGEYLRHLEQYGRAGVELASLPLVGLGSVCHRQHTPQVESLVRRLAGAGLRLHGFGFKTLGLARVRGAMASADSLAWSLAARRRPPLPGCPHRRCNHCPRFALLWREQLLARLDGGVPAVRRPAPLFEHWGPEDRHPYEQE